VPKRVAFVVSSAPSAELKAGQADATHIYSRLVDQTLGCCDNFSCLLPSCESTSQFSEKLDAVLKDWNVEDQFVFYFSGHGEDFNDVYCLKFGTTDKAWYPFSNIANTLRMHRVLRAIIILDACYSGKAIKSNDVHRIRDALPTGFAYLVSSGERQTSRETADGSVSVFTELLRIALDSGLGGKPTDDGFICVDDLASFMRRRLNDDATYHAYTQRPLWDVRKADERIWVAKNKSGSTVVTIEKDILTQRIHSEAELRILFDNTARERLPIPNATIEDLDETLIKRIFEAKDDGLDGSRSIIDLANELGLFASLPPGNQTFLHQASVICFVTNPEKFVPQATSTVVVGDVASTRFIRKEFRGALSVQFENILRETLNNLRTHTTIGQDGIRYEVEEIPPELIRELISNAFIHRNYSTAGGIEVAITDQWLEIKSPGLFKDAWDGLLQQDGRVSNPVDPALVLYSKDQGICEQIGRGFEIIRRYIDQNGSGSIVHDVLIGPTTRVRIKRPACIETDQSATLDPTKSTLVALSNIPIRVPEHFVGRDLELAQLRGALAHREGRVAITALHGLRGLGKSVLAAAYAELHRADYRATWWIRADTEYGIRADLVGLGVRLGWVDPEETEQAALAKVLDRLAHDGDHILLIYDNAVDASALRPYLPRGGAVRVLVTSNAPSWRGIAEPLEITMWPKEVGADFLIARTGYRAEREAAEMLSQALGGLPLAHEQAAAYCERLGISLSEYSRRFAAESARLLDADRDAPSEYHDSLTVAKTFALAIGQAAKLHPAAEALLLYAAILPAEPIPLFLFTQGREHFSDRFASMLAGDGLDEAIAALRAFALVNHETIVDERDPAIAIDTIRLHPLIRQVVVARCSRQTLMAMQRELTLAMAAVYPDEVANDPALWPAARRLDGLALGLLSEHEAPPEGAEREYSELLNLVGWYKAAALGAFDVARPLFERALAIRERSFGSNHPLTAESLNNLAALLHSQGDFHAGRLVAERGLAVTEAALGSSHPSVATSLYNLGSFLASEGDLGRARSVYERALAIREKVLGPDHPSTAASLNSIASLLFDQGDLKAAQSAIGRALAIRERTFGPDHPDTATSLSDLALLLQAQGDLSAARALNERALAIREKVLGPEHPDTATSLNNLGLVSAAEGDLVRAREFHDRALAIYEKVLGLDHPVTERTRRQIERLASTS
jgi:tetratricopeptide (TPR) repeat protein